MLAQCLRRWPNIKPALCQRLVFTGLLAHTATHIYWPVMPSVTVTRTTCLARGLSRLPHAYKQYHYVLLQHCWPMDQPVASNVG